MTHLRTTKTISIPTIPPNPPNLPNLHTRHLPQLRRLLEDFQLHQQGALTTMDITMDLRLLKEHHRVWRYMVRIIDTVILEGFQLIRRFRILVQCQRHRCHGPQR